MDPRGSKMIIIRRLAIMIVCAYSTTLAWSCNNTTSCENTWPMCSCTKKTKCRPIADCKPTIFRNMSLLPCNLTGFMVKKSQLKGIQNDAFQLPILKMLDLRDNKLDTEEIEVYAFRGLRNLETIHLSGNEHIHNFTWEWFQDLHALKRFYAHNCRISSIERNIFSNSRHITYVDLAHNRINYLHPRLFQGLEYLQMVNLKDNSLFILHEDAFSGSFNTAEISKIILSQNKFQTWNERFGIQDLSLHESSTLDLYDNPIMCDCEIRWLHAWLQYTNVSVNVSCASPSNVKRQQVEAFDTSNLQCAIQVWVVLVASVATVIVLLLFIGVLYRLNIRKIYHRFSLRWHYKHVSSC